MNTTCKKVLFTKDHMLYGSIYMKCPEKPNLYRQKHINDCQGLQAKERVEKMGDCQQSEDGTPS